MTSLARTLMVQGTASTVGKSTLVTGLCRVFAEEGLRVAPFKAQNMALNSFVTRDGREMGRAQVVQAEAAGIEPRVEMNPVLLKPEGELRSQVIVMGRPLATLEARDYWRNRGGLLDIVRDALGTLRREYDLVIIEGAGSPVELNLARNDIVNMQVARLVDVPVLLVGDIDRGGIFASLLGTLMLLPPDDRARVKGLIVNKFRGDVALWRDGERMLAERSGVPVLGTIPMFTDIAIAEEDSVPLDNASARPRQQQGKGGATLEIVVVWLPYLSNYDEFDALAAEPSVRLRFAAHSDEFPDHPDLIILPGTKSTLHDLAWLWRTGLAAHIRRLAAGGCAVFGICGGYQMLGERVSDPVGAETARGTVEPGLDLLPVETVFIAAREKVTLRTTAQIEPSAARGMFAHLDASPFSAYQIHVGRTAAHTETQNGADAFRVTAGGMDGWIDTGGWVAGCYLHGLYENDAFRHGIIKALAARHTIGGSAPVVMRTFDRQREYDKLAAVLRAHLAIDQIRSISKLR
jgi:adenosylcobyric acid synthase